MGYFPVRYVSKVVIYERKIFKRLASGGDIAMLLVVRLTAVRPYLAKFCHVGKWFTSLNQKIVGIGTYLVLGKLNFTYFSNLCPLVIVVNDHLLNKLSGYTAWKCDGYPRFDSKSLYQNC